MKKYYLHREASAFKVDYEKELNPEQYSAVMHQSGPALVLAGAGTGKTRVVTYRVARLIETGVRSENILLLTFTNKAAKEMMRRVELLIGRNIFGIYGGTFHHIGNLLLRQHYLLAGYRQGFSILDREDSRELLEACISDIYRKQTALPGGAVLSEICSLSKNTGSGISDTIMRRFPHFLTAVDDIEKISALYEKKKAQLNLLDFDDLLLGWKKILEENENIREYYSLKFKQILVDEYQDTNRLQSDIIDLTAGEAGNLMVVGDDAQSIYSFRGADFENILRFPERYKETAIYKLTTNYRSTPEILNLANKVISNNTRQFAKELHSVSKSGDMPGVVPLKDVFEQAEFVASVALDLNSDGKSFDKMATLYRSHYQSMELQMEFQHRGIPFEVRSGLKFFEQAHIKDILSFLKIIFNQHDEISWKRVLKLIPGIGNITAGKVWNYIHTTEKPLDSIGDAGRLIPKKAAEGFSLFLEILKTLGMERYHSMPSGAIDYVLRNGYEDYLYSRYPNAEMRIEDIEQMTKFALRYDSLETFISDLTLQGVTDAEAQDDEGFDGRVVLSTVHQAKGLEWEIVFMIGLNDGRFPSAKSLKNDDEEEERRLFYVGATRAKENLYLCYPVTSGDWNAVGFLKPSRFLKELSEDCFEEIIVEDV
ncbi:MAG: ATP-dependent helicase [Nitrospirota bacterium]